MEFPTNPYQKRCRIPPDTENQGTHGLGCSPRFQIPDFIMPSLLFVSIGLLTTLNLILCFPDFGAIIEQYNQF